MTVTISLGALLAVVALAVAVGAAFVLVLVWDRLAEIRLIAREVRLAVQPAPVPTRHQVPRHRQLAR